MSARRIAPRSVAFDDVPAFEDVVYIGHNNMAPEIARGSAVFLASPGYTGEGVYSLGGAFGMTHPADIRRVDHLTGQGRIRIDSWKDDPPITVSTEELRTAPLRRVAGVLVPLTADFVRFIQLRIRDGVR